MTIFVGGAHGAGKTYVTKPACEALGRPYATASQLIREMRGSSSWTSNKVVSDVDANQAALIAAVREINARGAALVLDGHFVLRTAALKHEVIPVEVFAALQCRAVILIECPLAVLSERLASRGDESWTAEELHRFQTAERSHAELVTRALGLPFLTLNSPDHLVMQTSLLRFSTLRAVTPGAADGPPHDVDMN
nr:ATP-binding protein [uncultured Roseateles sp.]